MGTNMAPWSTYQSSSIWTIVNAPNAFITKYWICRSCYALFSTNSASRQTTTSLRSQPIYQQVMTHYHHYNYHDNHHCVHHHCHICYHQYHYHHQYPHHYHYHYHHHHHLYHHHHHHHHLYHHHHMIIVLFRVHYFHHAVEFLN